MKTLIQRFFNNQSNTKTPVPAGWVCNYQNNYYGDQVCRPQQSK